MKKILAVLLLSIMMTGCGKSSDGIVETKTTEIKELSHFERHVIGDDYSIIVDKETGVCYLEYRCSAGYQAYYGITVMLNPDGTPKIWEE